MRHVVILAGALVALAGPAYGQARTEARRSAAPDVTLPKYRVVRTNGEVVLAVGCTKKGDWYVVEDIRGRKNTYAVASVRKVEDLSEEEAENAIAAQRAGPTAREGPGCMASDFVIGFWFDARLPLHVALHDSKTSPDRIIELLLATTKNKV